MATTATATTVIVAEATAAAAAPTATAIVTTLCRRPKFPHTSSTNAIYFN